MTKFILVLILTISSNVFASEMNEENTELISAYSEFSHELKENREFRRDLRRLILHKEGHSEAQQKIENFFADRKIFFGHITIRKANSISVGIINARSDEKLYAMGFGPRIGISRGYEVVACLLEDGLYNWGIHAIAIVGVGIGAGLHFGDSGACLSVSAAVGLEAGAVVEGMKIY